jgi:ferredoxin
MIIAEQKPLEDIKALIGEMKRVLVVGCGTCVTVCFAGGALEAAILASSLRMSFKLDHKVKEITDVTVQRRCEWEFLDQIEKQIKPATGHRTRGDHNTATIVRYAAASQ